MQRAVPLVLVLTLLLGATGCRNDPPGVDAAAAMAAAGSDQGLEDMIGRVAGEGVTAEAARTLAIAAVRRAPVVAARADTDPNTVREFVAALTDADPATIGPLTAAVVEGLAIALHRRLVAFNRTDSELSGPFTILLALERPSAELERFAGAVHAGADADEDDRQGALVAALEIAGPPRDGSLFSAIDDATLAGLGTVAPPAGSVIDQRLGNLRRKILASLLYADPSIRERANPRADARPDLTFEEFMEQAGTLVLRRLDSDFSRKGSPAFTLARLTTGSPGRD